jgi:hypothetical protein
MDRWMESMNFLSIMFSFYFLWQRMPKKLFAHSYWIDGTSPQFIISPIGFKVKMLPNRIFLTLFKMYKMYLALTPANQMIFWRDCERINSENISKILSQTVIISNTKLRIYDIKICVLSLGLHGYFVRFFTLKKECKLHRSDNKLLRKIFGPDKWEI